MLSDREARDFYEDWYGILETGYLNEDRENSLQLSEPPNGKFTLDEEADKRLQAEATAEIWAEISSILEERDDVYADRYTTMTMKELRDEFAEKDGQDPVYTLDHLRQSNILLNYICEDKDLDIEFSNSLMFESEYHRLSRSKNRALEYPSRVREEIEGGNTELAEVNEEDDFLKSVLNFLQDYF